MRTIFFQLRDLLSVHVGIEERHFSDADLHREGEVIRRGLRRANTAAVAIVLVVMALALAAIIQAYRVEQANRDATERLRSAYVAQARLGRSSGIAGQRFESLAAIDAAARIRASVELRNEAIAVLALTDVRPTTVWPLPAKVTSLYFDAVLDRYAFGDETGTIWIRRLADDREWARLPSIGARVEGIRFSGDGRLLAVRYQDEVRIWDLNERRTLWHVPSRWSMGVDAALAFSADSQHLAATIQEGLLRVYDAVSGRPEKELAPVPRPYSLAFAPGGKRLAISSGSQILLWDLEQNTLDKFPEHPVNNNWIAWRADGQLLAAACENGKVYVWDVQARRRQTLEGHVREAVYVSFNPDGDLLVSYSWDGTSRMWDPLSGTQILRTRPERALHFSPDGRRLAFQKQPLAVGVWEVGLPAGYRTLATPIGAIKQIKSPEFSPDGRLCAGVNLEGVWLWDVASGRQVASAATPDCRAVAFMADGQSLVSSGGGGLLRWPIKRSGHSLAAIQLGSPDRIELPRGLSVGALRLSPDRSKLAVDVGNGNGMILDLSSNSPPVLLRGQLGMANLAFSYDGKWIASGTWKGIGTWVWETQTGKPVFRSENNASAAVEFSPDGRWLVVATATEYSFWEVASWLRVGRSIPRDAIGEANGFMAFSPDSKLLALHANSELVRVVDPETSQEVARLTPPHPKALGRLCFSPDGGVLAVATEENVQLWDLRRVREQLAGWGLDWSAGNSGPTSISASGYPWLSSTYGGFILLTLAGVLFATALAVFVLKRHRKLIAGYALVDNLVVQRNRQLELAQTEIMHGQKMKALGTLAAGIAHDFNNLLSVIRMSNKLTGHEVKENREVQENVRLVEKAVGQGKQVVNAMLGYSRESIEADGWYSVVELVESACGLFSKQFLSGIELVIELDRSVPSVHGSAGRLEQILLNLVVNASEAMKQAGRMRIAVRWGAAEASRHSHIILAPRVSRRYLELIVTDSGPGIPPEIVNRIFEPFFTTKKSGASRGTGLGLSMVYSLAELDGLGISLETGPGQGTEILIAIPVD